MARIKIDGVIEAVRYNSNGMISLVRSYERHGVVWSDDILLDRNALVACLKNGKKFVTGQRKAYYGSVFETGKTIQLVNESIVTSGQPAGKDHLAGVSIF
ncbi:MAG TPA: hypothetical protein VMT91_00490 [Anaerolineales bacterium]|nr:hypothetical protein [Anaerolineales bacterium]